MRHAWTQFEFEEFEECLLGAFAASRAANEAQEFSNEEELVVEETPLEYPEPGILDCAIATQRDFDLLSSAC